MKILLLAVTYNNGSFVAVQTKHDTDILLLAVTYTVIS
jgi:hypothetical protein